jgi:hypothetical protein
MRRLAKRNALLTMVVGIAAIVGPAACSVHSKAPAWADPSGAKTTGASTPDVCGRIRAAISSDMKPIGSALGSLVGYAAASDDSGRTNAQEQVQQQVKALGDDIGKASTDAADAKLKSAVTTAVANLNTLAADPALLASVNDVSDIPDISRKLDDATHPIAVACG